MTLHESLKHLLGLSEKSESSMQKKTDGTSDKESQDPQSDGSTLDYSFHTASLNSELARLHYLLREKRWDGAQMVANGMAMSLHRIARIAGRNAMLDNKMFATNASHKNNSR